MLLTTALLKPASLDPPRGGWAPGDYMCECASCGAPFIGDKRSVVCAECAYEGSVTSWVREIPGAGLVRIMVPFTSEQRSRLLATSRWHRTQAAIARRKRSERDRLRHSLIAREIDKVLRAYDRLTR